MIRFESDYLEGAHPRILERLLETNLEQTPGYGLDYHCERARELIKAACGNDGVDVHFIVGGTQANLTVIASALCPFQGAIAADSGHIGCHETGAIEATGHKVLPLASVEGKITAAQISEYIDEHNASPTREHIVQPGMVYISFPTEDGTIYSLAELEDISAACKEHGVYLFIDGARLGYGLACAENDVTLSDLARLCDVFYIGGTKVGALFGEAVVISNDKLKKDFRYNIKQRGALLAKGRLLGIQFETLFEDGLYFDISKRAVALAMRIKKAFADAGAKFLYDSPTNQQFPILPNGWVEALSKKYTFETWQRVDGEHSAVRFCTSFATREEDVNALVEDIAEL